MNTTSILIMLTGLFVRLGVPLLITALVILVLRNLDARWQAEAEQERKLLAKGQSPCWVEQGLSMEEIKKHTAKNEQPCWQSQRLSNGYLQQECLDCEVFLSAPIPVSKQTTV